MSDNSEGEEVNHPSSLFSNAGHPLLNPVVASTLFELVNLSQLRTLRLVCKDWHSLSLPLWRRSVQINIYSQCSSPRLLQWKSLGNELDGAGEQPFRNFRLHVPEFLSDISRRYVNPFVYSRNVNFEPTYRNMEGFWVNYGHWIHKLELKKVYVTDVVAFKKAIFEQTPKLQELTVDKLFDKTVQQDNPLPVPADEDEGTGPNQPNLNLKTLAIKKCTKFPFGWRVLFTHFPNIEKLEISEPNWIDEFFECVETMLRNAVRRPNLLITDLRLVDFRLTFTGTVQGLLQNPQVKLRVLHLSFMCLAWEPVFDLDALQTALQFHGNTLKELHLQIDGQSIDFWTSQVGPFVSLTELQVKGSSLAFNLHFLDKFPNLKVLRLEQIFEDEMLRETNWTTLEKMPQLREFYFIVKQSRSLLSAEILERLAEIMPNLESFTGQLSNLSLRVVCRNWRRLKKLAILSGKFLDEDEEEDPYRLRNIMDIDDVGITGIVPGSDERLPCVADLQELRHLTLGHVTLIGDASVFDGFLKLPYLSSLNICETNNISEGLDVLRKHLQGGLTISPLCRYIAVNENDRVSDFYWPSPP